MDQWIVDESIISYWGRLKFLRNKLMTEIRYIFSSIQCFNSSFCFHHPKWWARFSHPSLSSIRILWQSCQHTWTFGQRWGKLMGTPWLAGHVPMEPGMGGGVDCWNILLLCILKLKNQILPPQFLVEKSSSFIEHFPACRGFFGMAEGEAIRLLEFEALHHALRQDGAGAKPWHIAIMGDFNTASQSAVGNAQFGWMAGTCILGWGNYATIFLLGWFIEKIISTILANLEN